MINDLIVELSSWQFAILFTKVDIIVIVDNSGDLNNFKIVGHIACSHMLGYNVKFSFYGSVEVNINKIKSWQEKANFLIKEKIIIAQYKYNDI